MLAVDFEKRLGDFHLRPRFRAEDEFVVLLGPSGAGKSLTLQAIAGLLRPDRGRIELGGSPVFDADLGVDVPPQVRNVGYVVQDLALFPHLSVAENIGFGLKGRAKAARKARVDELLGLLDLAGFEERMPGSLSGGQQQRVALGRALAARPSVLLLDEPFSALDAPVRHALRREVARLRRQLGLLAVFVTHDLQEAYALADSIAVLDAGAVLQYAPRDDLFRNPASVRVAELTETRNILHGRVRVASAGCLEVEVDEAGFILNARSDGRFKPGDPVATAIRPEHVILLRPDRPHSEEMDTILDIEIEDEEATGNNHRLFLRVMVDGRPTECLLEADVSSHPYEVMGIAARRDWRVALTLDRVAPIPL